MPARTSKLTIQDSRTIARSESKIPSPSQAFLITLLAVFLGGLIAWRVPIEGYVVSVQLAGGPQGSTLVQAERANPWSPADWRPLDSLISVEPIGRAMQLANEQAGSATSSDAPESIADRLPKVRRKLVYRSDLDGSGRPQLWIQFQGDDRAWSLVFMERLAEQLNRCDAVAAPRPDIGRELRLARWDLDRERHYERKARLDLENHLLTQLGGPQVTSKQGPPSRSSVSRASPESPVGGAAFTSFHRPLTEQPPQRTTTVKSAGERTDRSRTTNQRRYDRLLTAFQSATRDRQQAEDRWLAALADHGSQASSSTDSTTWELSAPPTVRTIGGQPSARRVSFIGLLAMVGATLIARFIGQPSTDHGRNLPRPTGRRSAHRVRSSDAALPRRDASSTLFDRQRIAWYTVRGCEWFLALLVVVLVVAFLSDSPLFARFVKDPLGTLTEAVTFAGC